MGLTENIGETNPFTSALQDDFTVNLFYGNELRGASLGWYCDMVRNFTIVVNGKHCKQE